MSKQSLSTEYEITDNAEVDARKREVCMHDLSREIVKIMADGKTHAFELRTREVDRYETDYANGMQPKKVRIARITLYRWDLEIKQDDGI